LPSPSELDRLRVILVRTRNPLNIGASARAMSNFGFAGLRVVQPYNVAFREARSAVGASNLLAAAEVYENVAEAIADCTLVVGTTAARGRELHQPLRTLEDAAKLIHKRLASDRVALLFGSEKRGLSTEDLSHCHWLLRIPTRQAHGSMNLGQAVAVTLYELARKTQRFTPERAKRAPAEEVERITRALVDALHSSGFIKAGAAGSSEIKIRRLIRRLNLAEADAELLQGMLRQILWKLRTR
jgi:TrmH family RNA methyltransferase